MNTIELEQAKRIRALEAENTLLKMIQTDKDKIILRQYHEIEALKKEIRRAA